MSTEPIKITIAQKFGLGFCAILIALYLILPDPAMTEEKADKAAMEWIRSHQDSDAALVTSTFEELPGGLYENRVCYRLRKNPFGLYRRTFTFDSAGNLVIASQASFGN